MSKRKKHAKPTSTNAVLKKSSLNQAEHLPHDDRMVLKEEPGLPLERGGIYSEMGADLTYEELSSFPLSSKEYSQYEHHQDAKENSFVEIIGIMLIFIGLFIVINSPLWFSFITLGIMLVAKRHSMKTTMSIAAIFTAVSLIFALYSLL